VQHVLASGFGRERVGQRHEQQHFLKKTKRRNITLGADVNRARIALDQTLQNHTMQ
jgi:hypothetical protein